MSKKDVAEPERTGEIHRRRHKIEFLRVRLPPTLSLISDSNRELEREKELVFIGVRKDSLKTSRPEKKAEKDDMKEVPVKIYDEKIKRKTKKESNSIIMNDKKITPIKKELKLKEKKGDSNAEEEISVKFIVAVILLMVTSLVGGYLIAGHLCKETETNLFGLVVNNAEGKLPDTIKILGSQSQELTISNKNGHAVTLKLIAWGWDSPETSRKVLPSWDYDGTPIPPGSQCRLNLSILSDLTDGQEFSFNINILSLTT